MEKMGWINERVSNIKKRDVLFPKPIPSPPQKKSDTFGPKIALTFHLAPTNAYH